MLKHVFVIYGEPKVGKSILANLMTNSFSNKFKVQVVEDYEQSFSSLCTELIQKAETSKQVKYVGTFDYDDYFVVITHSKERALELAKKFKKDFLKELRHYHGRRVNFLVSICGMEAVL